MRESGFVSVRSVIMELLKSKLGVSLIWKKIEADVAMACAEMPEPTTPGKLVDFITKLKRLKNFLIEQEILPEDLKFIDEEIERYEQTKTISLYEEEEDQIDPAIIKSYARLGKGTEGVVGIHHNFNYRQLVRLTNGVYDETGLIKFYISQERTLYGKIIAEIYEYAQKIPIASLYESKKMDEEGEPVLKRIALFGEKVNRTEWEKIKEINIPFYIYRFISEQNDEMILISPEKCEIGDYIVTGVLTQCDDYKDLTDSTKILTKLPFFFAQSVHGRIIRYRNHRELFIRANAVGICNKEMFEYPFTISKGNKTWKLLQPTWYKWLIWSWLTHERKGLINPYPMHILQIGPKHCLPKGTLVKTSEGWKPIENVNEVLAVDYDGKIKKQVARSVNNGVQKCWKIKVGSREIVCSGNHKWFIIRNGRVLLSETKGLLDTDYLMNYNGKDLSGMQKEFQNLSFSDRKEILQQVLLPQIQRQISDWREKPHVEGNTNEGDNSFVQKRFFYKYYLKNVLNKLYFTEKEIKEIWSEIKDTFRTNENNKEKISKELGREIRGQEKSCIYSWKKYWIKEKQEGIPGYCKRKHCLDVPLLYKEENKQKFQSDCSSCKPKQQGQQNRELDDIMSILPLKIASITEEDEYLEMYDLQVPYYNNFIIEGDIISHNSGKSLMLNALHAKSKETRSVFSGSSSTLKHLVPSFKYNPAKLGYLAESNRFSFCDEFLRCLVNTRTTKEGAEREEGVAIMNDLLEHQKRLAGSGVSQVHVNMTSRIVATTNPVKGIQNVEDLINHFDESFLSRWMIYFQTEDHVQMIRKSKDSLLAMFSHLVDLNDWISFIDYLHTFSAEYDMKRVEEVYEAVPNVLSETLKKHYDARHMHHIECLMDGIVKTRCFLEGDSSFQANEQDYKILKEVWLNLVSSWIKPEHIRSIDVKDRIFYLPENCQFIYWRMNELKKPISKEEAEKLSLKGMSLKEYYTAWSLLVDMGLIKESDGRAKLWYFSDEEEESEDSHIR